jgi:hypothetical protein
VIVFGSTRSRSNKIMAALMSLVEPGADELEVLRDLHARTAEAHGAAGEGEGAHG